MSATLFDLLKYAATGVASPEMTHYDKMRALSMAGGKIATLTGIPPLSFRANGKPLISWSMLGNRQQTGTPTPSAPIQPEFVGVRTANLFDVSTAVFGKYIDSSGVERNSSTGETNHSAYIAITPSTNYSLAATKPNYNTITSAISWYDSSKNFIIRSSYAAPGAEGRFSWSAQSPNNAAFAIINFQRYPNYSREENDMLNSGSTALSYEPYGWKVPITCAGQTVPIYLGQVSTVRRVKKLVLDGTEDWRVVSGKFYLDSVTPDYMRSANNITHICSHFDAYQQTNSASNVPDDRIAFGAAAYSQRLYCTYTGVSTPPDFKAYLAAQYAAGTPVTVWYVLAEPTTATVNEPLCKIGDYADELHSEDAGVTIPTVRGQNVLTIDTTLQPTSVSVTGHIKQS